MRTLAILVLDRFCNNWVWLSFFHCLSWQPLPSLQPFSPAVWFRFSRSGSSHKLITSELEQLFLRSERAHVRGCEFACLRFACVSGLCRSAEDFLLWSILTCLAASSSLRWDCRSWCQPVLRSMTSTSITATTSTVTQGKVLGFRFPHQ